MAGLLFAAPAWAQTPAAPGLAAFDTMLSVLQSPRCMNCHTNGANPRQGDDRHLHLAGVTRGLDGHGAIGLPCATCHQASNQANGVPGAQDWHLATLSMGWEGLSPAGLCRLLLDPKRNGNRSAADLVTHFGDPTLVAWAWAGGNDIDGHPRGAPAISQTALIEAARVWAASGAPCPHE